MKNKKAEGLFNATALQVFHLFNNNHHDNKRGYMNNITGIAKDAEVSHVTAHKYLRQMVAAGILEELFVGNNGKVFSLNKDSTTTKAFIALIEVVDERGEGKEKLISGEEKRDIKNKVVGEKRENNLV